MRFLICVLCVAAGLVCGATMNLARGYRWGRVHGYEQAAREYERAAIARGNAVRGSGLNGFGPFQWIVHLHSSKSAKFPDDVFMATDEATVYGLLGELRWRLNSYWPAKEARQETVGVAQD